MTTRRAVIQAVTLAPLLAACAPEVLLRDPAAVRIAVPWSGRELQAFRAVLAAAELEHPVEVVPLGDDIGTALTIRGRSAPDIVMLPQAGQVRKLAADKRLQPLDPALWSDPDGPFFSDPWPQLCNHQGRPYAIPFKASAKSVVWYDRKAVEGFGLGDPQTWTVSDWGKRVQWMTGSQRRFLALGAADGWALTDMFENLLLGESPAVYETLGSGPGPRDWEQQAVRTAFRGLGALWGARDGLPGGVGTALTRQFADTVRDVFEHGRALLTVAPDFAEPVVLDSIRRSGRSADAVGVTSFPAAGTGRARPRIVACDVMVLTATAAPRAAEVLGKLAAPQATVPWIERFGGFISPDRRTAARYSPWAGQAAADLKSGAAFDLSDRIGALGGRDGLWRILTDFLIAVGDKGIDINVATGDALAELARFERGWR